MTTRDELHRLIDAIPDSARDEARVLLVDLLQRQESDAELDAVAGDPAAKARLNELIQVGLEELARGETIDGEIVLAELRAKSRRYRGLE